MKRIKLKQDFKKFNKSLGKKKMKKLMNFFTYFKRVWLDGKPF